MQHPETRKGDVTETLHGKQVADPYRWLETTSAPPRRSPTWVEAENKVTFGYLETIPARSRSRSALPSCGTTSAQAPFKAGGRYFFTSNNGLQNQSVLYVSDIARRQAERVLMTRTSWPKTARWR